MRVFPQFSVTQLNAKSIQLPALIVSVIVGVVLGLMILRLGMLTLAIVVGVMVLPWFIRAPFRLYIWLIVTWPVFSLYLRVRLAKGVPDINYERVLVPLIMAIVVTSALALKTNLPRIGIWVGIYVMSQIISYGSTRVLGGMSTASPVIFLKSLILPISMYWLTKTLIVSKWHLQRLLYALILSSVIICMTGLYERAIGARESPFPVNTGTASGERYLGVSGGRAAGVSGNPAIYGAVMGMGVLASLCCFVHTEQKPAKIVFGMVAALLTYGVFVSFTRSAWIATLVAVFFFLFLIKDLWKHTLPFLVVGLVPAALILVVASDRILDNQLIQDRLLEQGNVVGRMDRLSFSWDLFVEKPFLGWGSGALDVHMNKEFTEEGFNVSHNTFFTFLVDGGLLVFCSFSALMISVLARAIQILQRGERHSFERSASGVMIGCLLIFLLSGLALELKFFSYFNTLFWIAIGTIERLWDTTDKQLPLIDLVEAND